MKTNRNPLAGLFSPFTRDLFAYVIERTRENPVCWSFFILCFVLTLLDSLLAFLNAVGLLPH